MQLAEDLPGYAVGGAYESEEYVLGVDVVVLERPRLVLGEDDDLATPVGEPLEHSSEAYG